MWQGDSVFNRSDHKRSIALTKLKPLFELKDIEFISLQKDEGRDQIKLNNYENLITDFFGKIDIVPFEDTLAIVDNLNMIISVDTSIAHIAATLEKETWVMLPYVPDFRWELNNTKTIWYDSVRLFRQKKINQWGEIIDTIKESLKRKFNIS